MNITIDCDEVLSETLDAVLEYHHWKILWKEIKKENITNYHMHEMKKIDLTIKEEHNFLFSFMRKPESILKIKPVQWAKEKLIKWKEDWHKLYVVTWRWDGLKENTEKRINMNFPWLFESIHFANTHRPNQRNKSEILNELNSELMVEDFLYYAQDIADAGIKTFLLDKPRNQEYDKERMKKIEKVISWNDINI